ncbi:MAG: M48 family metallopeptidase [Gammaproteobacteria bacterium]|nr:M48 family metallopeptidase [Gammaproteobacteria bacterium]
MKYSYTKQAYYLLLLIVSASLLSACNTHYVNQSANGIPASVFRNSLNNLPSHYYSSSKIKNSIFRPDFINLLVNINREEGPMDIFRLRDAVDNWNTVTTNRNESIKYNGKHFYRFAALGDTDKTNCLSETDCTIDLGDIIVAQSWFRWQPHQSTLSSKEQNRPSLEAIAKQPDQKLLKTLQSIYRNPIGERLIEHALKTNLKIELRVLEGKHGYYSYNDNLIVIDPKVINYEFNMRYLVHELVHASNQTISNSIEEEVFAEYIGLMVQNQITDIPFELSAYSMFVDHVLHDEYGQLPVNNNIKGQLLALGIDI